MARDAACAGGGSVRPVAPREQRQPRHPRARALKRGISPVSPHPRHCATPELACRIARPPPPVPPPLRRPLSLIAPPRKPPCHRIQTQRPEERAARARRAHARHCQRRGSHRLLCRTRWPQGSAQSEAEERATRLGQCNFRRLPPPELSHWRWAHQTCCTPAGRRRRRAVRQCASARLGTLAPMHAVRGQQRMRLCRVRQRCGRKSCKCARRGGQVYRAASRDSVLSPRHAPLPDPVSTHAPS